MCYALLMIDRERIQRMASAGYTAREIARELGASNTRVSQILRQSEPIEVTATVRAPNKHTIIIETSDAQIAGVAIKRAFERAGILVKAEEP